MFGQTNKWSTDLAYANSVKYCISKDFKYMVYFAIVILDFTGNVVFCFGMNWKASSGKNR